MFTYQRVRNMGMLKTVRRQPAGADTLTGESDYRHV